MTYQRKIGNLGEEIAAKYLIDQGFQLIDKNYTTRYGELDLIMMESGSVVIVEVKTRTSDKFGTPESSITEEKLDRLEKAALLWFQDHPEVVDDWRIDVIAISLDHQKNVRDLQHFISVQ